MKKSDQQKNNATISHSIHKRDTRRMRGLFPSQYDIGEKDNIYWSRPLGISFSQFCSLIIFFIVSLSGSSFAATRYVWTNSPSPGSGFLTWNTASRTIQDAIDVADSNDMVLVTNGVYITGGVTNYATGSLLTNRVAIYKPITVRSVNGPLVTIISGARGENSSGNGDRAIRGVYMTNGAVLSGFTITNGHTRILGDNFREEAGGGVWCESAGATISNCIIRQNTAYLYGHGAFKGTYYNCTFDRNGNAGSSVYGGGVYDGTLYKCILTGNYGNASGGGAFTSRLTNCSLENNTAFRGGGAASSTLSKCNLVGNIASYGGGVYMCTAYSSSLGQNGASAGGGAYDSLLYSCAIIENIATAFSGGGAALSTLYNCTVIGNRLTSDVEGFGPRVNVGGGVYACDVYDSIVYYNEASSGANYDDGIGASSLSNCCTWPLPIGAGNFTNSPGLAGIDNPHLTRSSSCIDRYSGVAGHAADIDGEVRTNGIRVDVGCDELWVAETTDSLAAAISIWPYTNTVVDYPLQFKSRMQGKPLSFVINYGDGTASTNEAVTEHAFKSAGSYNIVLRATNLADSVSVTAVVQVASAAISTRFVTTNGNDMADGTSWIKAKATIQAAIDSAPSCGLVMVSNGIYASGGCTSKYSRISITNAIRVQSVNGPSMTTIRGQDKLGDISAMRCAYVADGCFLFGFTLTNGFTAGAGDVYTDCGGAAKCDSPAGIISNCVLTTSAANLWGGGCYNGTLLNCKLINNLAADGGGVILGILKNCVVSHNEAFSPLSGNIGGGGGANNALLLNCSVRENDGAGVNSCQLYNCTLAGNSSQDLSGGSVYSALHNSIAYFNTCESGNTPNHYQSIFDYSCTFPLPSGTGNISNDPEMSSLMYLSKNSPCIAKGNIIYISGVDIDGDPWNNPPSMGCDEVGVGSITGTLAVAATAFPTNLSTGVDVTFTGFIEGPTIACAWDFRDGTIASNCPVVTHKFATPGNYSVLFWAYNDAFPEGVADTVIVHVENRIFYVNANNDTPYSPFASWDTAATNIQDAIDIATPGALVLVTNGIYATGIHNASRIVLSNQVKVCSVNGPDVTVIKGQGPTGADAVRCASLGYHSMLSGFTLTEGATCLSGSYLDQSGGGASCEATGILSNCVIIGNTAWRNGGGIAGGIIVNSLLSSNSTRVGDGGGAYDGLLQNCSLVGNYASGDGGGAYDGLLHNCLLVGNYASDWGGGCAYATLVNCTVVSNTGDYGGGTASCKLTNSIVYYNTAYHGSNSYFDTIQFSCTAPLAAGTGNISAFPQFVNLICNNYRLTSNSLCINAGTNQSWMIDMFDIDGNSRIWGGQVDMGAYEYLDENRPEVLNDASYGIVSNRFGFNINWDSGQVVVVDASTNLTQTNWIPLVTGTLTGVPYYFFDSKWTNYIGRFYRIRSP